MNGNLVEPSLARMAIAAGLILINAGISWGFKLGLAKSLLTATLQGVVQLALVGMLLEWLFRVDHPGLVFAWCLAMTCAAGVTAAGRTSRSYPGLVFHSLISVAVGAWPIVAIGLLGVLGEGDAWRKPQYIIPLLGMVLGNSLNGVAVGLANYVESIAGKREEIETMLALGAEPWEAGKQWVQNAIRAGMTPLVNTLKAVGIVSLPGMMTGQILGGSSPQTAVKYQLMILFMIAAASSLATVCVVLLAHRQLFNSKAQFRPELLQPKGGKRDHGERRAGAPKKDASLPM